VTNVLGFPRSVENKQPSLDVRSQVPGVSRYEKVGPTNGFTHLKEGAWEGVWEGAREGACEGAWEGAWDSEGAREGAKEGASEQKNEGAAELPLPLLLDFAVPLSVFDSRFLSLWRCSQSLLPFLPPFPLKDFPFVGVDVVP